MYSTTLSVFTTVSRRSDSDTCLLTLTPLRSSPTVTQAWTKRSESCPPLAPIATPPACGRSPRWRSALQRRPLSLLRPQRSGRTARRHARSGHHPNGGKRKAFASLRPRRHVGRKCRGVGRQQMVVRMRVSHSVRVTAKRGMPPLPRSQATSVT